MTDKPSDSLPTPTGWVVMREVKDGPFFVVPTWICRGSDGENVVVIGHPGGVIVDGNINPDLGSVAEIASSMLAACKVSSEQRIHGQAAVQRLLESIRPADDTTTLEDLIKKASEQAEQDEKRRSAKYTHLSELFSSLRDTLDDLGKDKPEGGES